MSRLSDVGLKSYFRRKVKEEETKEIYGRRQRFTIKAPIFFSFILPFHFHCYRVKICLVVLMWDYGRMSSAVFGPFRTWSVQIIPLVCLLIWNGKGFGWRIYQWQLCSGRWYILAVNWEVLRRHHREIGSSLFCWVVSAVAGWCFLFHRSHWKVKLRTQQ